MRRACRYVRFDPVGNLFFSPPRDDGVDHAVATFILKVDAGLQETFAW